jgi:predicted acetyltransferase
MSVTVRIASAGDTSRLLTAYESPLRRRSLSQGDWHSTTCYRAIYREQAIGRIAIRHELNDFLRTGHWFGFRTRPRFTGFRCI